jgi:hypothetical protein
MFVNAQGQPYVQNTKVRTTADMSGLTPGAQAILEGILAAAVAPELNITSAFRSPEHNARVGGARNSRHTRGDALDISTKGMTDAQRTALIEAAVASGARGIGVYPSGAVHFDARDTPAFWGVGGSYSGADPSAAPAWAQPALAKLFGGQAPTQVARAPAGPAPAANPLMALMAAAGEPAPAPAAPTPLIEPQGIAGGLTQAQPSLMDQMAQYLDAQAAAQAPRPVQPLIPLPDASQIRRDAGPTLSSAPPSLAELLGFA